MKRKWNKNKGKRERENDNVGKLFLKLFLERGRVWKVQSGMIE